ncbi:MAG: hypothetical protein F6J97_24900, partial [Leptolyngbya sp. SIO4C1]|nr:hypothetical protein [Leptolyngbya sp. SIO4C1]
IVNIVWKADAHELNDRQTTQAIKKFKEIVQAWKSYLNPYRTGFIARPFSDERSDFIEAEACIKEFLIQHQIQAKRYTHPPGGSYVVSEIMNQIKDSHFGIIDITQLNANVMLELGMIMILNKKFVLLRHRQDDTELPFDIKNYHCYQYEVRRGGVFVWSPGDSDPTPLEEILKSFVTELYRDRSFCDAKPFVTTAQRNTPPPDDASAAG